MDGDQDPSDTKKIRREQLWRGATTGDSTARYEFIRQMFNVSWPREEIEDKKLVCVLPIGYPDEVPRVPRRLEERIEWIGF